MSLPKWWPENPYPEWLFPMTVDEYCKALPDTKLRTAVSGHIARWQFGVASSMIHERLQTEIEDMADQLRESMVDLDPEVVEAINKRFWGLLD